MFAFDIPSMSAAPVQGSKMSRIDSHQVNLLVQRLYGGMFAFSSGISAGGKRTMCAPRDLTVGTSVYSQRRDTLNLYDERVRTGKSKYSIPPQVEFACDNLSL